MHVGLNRSASVAAARNRGANAGEGDVGGLLNNDVYCRPHWLKRLIGPLEAGPRTASVVRLLLTEFPSARDD